MKKMKYIITLIILGTIIFASCEKNDPILFQNEDTFIAFQATGGSVVEATLVDGVPVENTIEITVMVVTLDEQPLTVDFYFDTLGIENPAVEGEAFTLLNDSKTLSFPEGWGTAKIRIRTIDDDIFTGNRSVNIKLGENSAGYPNGVEDTYRLTVVDDEHPLALVLGTYNVAGTDWWGDAFSTTVETSAVDGDITRVQFPVGQACYGWGVPETYIAYADVDLDEMTFNIKAGQEFPNFGFGPFKITGFVGGGTTETIEDGQPVRATIDEDGNIYMVDHIRFMITDGANAGLHFDIWDDDVVWTKTGKKSAGRTDVSDDRERVLRAY